MSFDNLYANTEIGWLSDGFVDFIVDHYRDHPAVHARKSAELEKTLAEIRNNPEEQTARNLVLSGAFERRKGEYIVELQLVDVISWKTVADQKVVEKSADLAQLVETVNSAIDEILALKSTRVDSTGETEIAQNQTTEPEKSPQQHVLTAATKNIGDALEALVSTYYEQPKTSFITESHVNAEQSSLDAFSQSIRGFVEESRSFEEIVNRIFDDPYLITIGEPALRRLPLETDKVALSFRVEYRMKNEVLEEMIETLRYRNKNEQRAFTEYTFSGNDYIFTNEFVQKVAHGQYRFFPVISLLDDDNSVITRLNDTPGQLNQFTHFNPMFNIATSPWSMMIYLNKEPQSIDYELVLPIQTIAKIARVTIDMINEDAIIALD